MNAEMIITNAKVLTMDEGRPRAEAVAIGAGRILAVGTRAEVEALAGPGTHSVDAGGRTLLPGFVEAHMHLGLGGAELNHLHLYAMHGEESLRAAYAEFAAARPGNGFLMAEGADYHIIGRDITRADLDAFTGDRPFAIRAMDHHTVWANTAALKAAGLLHGRAMPHGHEVVMAPDGTATGELREFEAFAPILELAGIARMNAGIATGEEPSPVPTAAERAVDKDHIARGLAHCARHGIAAIVNMDGNRYMLQLLAEMQAEGRLTARVVVPFHMKPHMGLDALERASAMTRDFRSDWLRSGFVKMFMDGVVDSRTAYMLEDYPGHPGHRSEPLFDPARFDAICIEADRRGLQIAVHAIGDGAVRQTIDGYEAAQKANGKRDSRHRIEHIELIDRADVPRLGALGITASVQPPHPPGAMDFPMSTMETVFHKRRWKDAYLWKTLADHGAPLAFASDWPVTDISILRGIQAALTRVPYEGAADERVGLMEVLRAYTAGAAWSAHLEDVTGTIRPGLAADLVLIDGDIEAIPADRIGGTGIALTIAGGRVTHDPASMAGVSS